MVVSKKQIVSLSALIFYVLSLCANIGVGVYILITFMDFIVNSKGIGVYGGLLYYASAFLSFIFWGVSYWLIPNKKLAIFYWSTLLIFVIFFAVQPAWWAAPSIT